MNKVLLFGPRTKETIKFTFETHRVHLIEQCKRDMEQIAGRKLLYFSEKQGLTTLVFLK
jgi:hypothetical protein